MDIFLAILPAIFWGSIVLFNVKLGGGPYSQTLGTTFGALIFSIVVYIFMKPSINTYRYRSWSCVRFILGAWSGKSIEKY